MDIADNKVRVPFRQQMIVRLPECSEYRQFIELMSSEYEVIEAETSEDMYTIICGPRERLACVVIDAAKGRKVGFEIHHRMNADMRFVAIPTVALTCNPSKEECEAVLAEGMSDYIALPAYDELVLARIRNAVRSKDSATIAEIEKMLSQLPSNIYLKDNQGRYVFATHYWHHLRTAGDPEWTIRGKTDLEIRKDKENAKLAFESDKRMLATGEGTSYIIEEKDGPDVEYLELIKRPVYDRDGNINGIIALINNVTEYQLLKKELEKRSRTDLLTGLLNKNTALELIEMALSSSQKRAGGMALLVIDADRFKKINDTHGHAIGDQVLKTIGRAIHEVFNDIDICGRYGGDEFIVLLREIGDRHTALLLSEHLRKTLAQKVEGKIYQNDVSVSIGIALYPEQGKTLLELFEEADQALYHVKHEGGNGEYIR